MFCLVRFDIVILDNEIECINVELKRKNWFSILNFNVLQESIELFEYGEFNWLYFNVCADSAEYTHQKGKLLLGVGIKLFFVKILTS